MIRHGEPIGGRAIRGNSIDDPLSQPGWQQMRVAVNNYSKWDVIISSPLIRCLAFARELSLKLDIPLLIEENLKEVGFGSWEGRTQDEIKKNNPDEYSNFYLDPVKNRPESAESLPAFSARVVAAYNEIIEKYEDQGILLITHAGVIRAIITHILQAELSSMYRIKVHNAGITRLQHNGKYSILEGHGFSLR